MKTPEATASVASVASVASNVAMAMSILAKRLNESSFPGWSSVMLYVLLAVRSATVVNADTT